MLGLGAADTAVASHDASSWLWSTVRGELARANGITARVDTRVEVPGARRHPAQVTQTDRLLVLRDLTTGQVSSLDLATLQIAATTQTTPGLGVSVALHEDSRLRVGRGAGGVRQLDRGRWRRSVSRALPAGHHRGHVDGEGRMWVAVPIQGTVRLITAATLPSAPPRRDARRGRAQPEADRGRTTWPAPSPSWWSPRWTRVWRCSRTVAR